MRVLMVIAGAALALSACGQDQAAENTVNIDAAATADGIGSNDTTAIDAATGDDANMAADVNFTLEDSDNIDANSDTDENAANNAD